VTDFRDTIDLTMTDTVSLDVNDINDARDAMPALDEMPTRAQRRITAHDIRRHQRAERFAPVTSVLNALARTRLAAGIEIAIRRSATGLAAASRHKTAVAASAVAVALIAGAIVVTNAVKTITMDVDGQVTQFSTFARSVDSLLAGRDIELGADDIVSPALDDRLVSGDVVVIRFGRQVTLSVDGEKTDAVIAALDASDVLALAAHRGADVRLVASRAGGRTQLPIRLAAGHNPAVAIVADGHAHTVTYTGGDAEDLIASAGITLEDTDIVTVMPASRLDVTINGDQPVDVAIVVQRVAVHYVAYTDTVAYQSETRTDSGRFSDLPVVVVQRGQAGEVTRTYAVTTVDGAETARERVSEEVTVEPVTHITSRGTRTRPTPPPAAAGGATYTGGNIPDSVWRALAHCESGGRPHAVSPGGRFHGLYQFSVATWRSVGGQGLPSQASPAEQRQRAVALQARSGWGQWPSCSRRIGVR
jgi:uncharacterized protein YabE (DUF348 family)